MKGLVDYNKFLDDKSLFPKSFAHHVKAFAISFCLKHLCR